MGILVALVLAQSMGDGGNSSTIDSALRNLRPSQHSEHDGLRGGLDPSSRSPHGPPTLSPERGFARLFDDRSLEVVQDANRVEVIRLKASQDGYMTVLANQGEPAVHGFAIDHRAGDLAPDLVAKLKAHALTPSSYNVTGGTKLCGGFQPKVVFRFWREEAQGKDSVDILLCFNCSDVMVIQAPSTTPGERLYSLADMAGSRPAWLALAKAALPNDAQIQPTRPEH